MPSLNNFLTTLHEIVPTVSLSPSDYVGYLCKRLPDSSQIAQRRAQGHGAHIQITGADAAMAVLPVVTSSRYLADREAAHKRRFVAQLDVGVNRGNLLDLVQERLANPLTDALITTPELQAHEARLAGSDMEWLPSHAESRFSWRATGQQQLEIGSSAADVDFHLLRRLLRENDFLVLLQRGAATFDALGITQEAAGARSLEGFQAPSITAMPVTGEQIAATGLMRNAADSPSLQTGSLPVELRQIASLLDRRKNVVLYGPPGTGKTRDAFRIADVWMAQHGPDAVFRVTFHPTYAYEDFVQGYRPAAGRPGEFWLQDGALLEAAKVAWSGKPTLLLVDEINRADVARVFGEVITYLEADKRGVKFRLSQSPAREYALPHNLYLLATMNVADKSISLLDVAMRRRFSFIGYAPNPGMFDGTEYAATVGGVDLGSLLAGLNARLLDSRDDPDRLIGQALLGIPAADLEPLARLRERIFFDVVPLIEEYCYYDRSVVVSLIPELVDEHGEPRELTDPQLVSALLQIQVPGAPIQTESVATATPPDETPPADVGGVPYVSNGGETEGEGDADQQGEAEGGSP